MLELALPKGAELPIGALPAYGDDVVAYESWRVRWSELGRTVTPFTSEAETNDQKNTLTPLTAVSTRSQSNC